MEMRGSWTETKEKLKKLFIIVTDSDMLFIEENEEKILSRLQDKLGKSKDEIKKILGEL